MKHIIFLLLITFIASCSPYPTAQAVRIESGQDKQKDKQENEIEAEEENVYIRPDYDEETLKEHQEDVLAYQEMLNGDYSNPDKSPLLEEDFNQFKTLPFFPIDIDYKVEAKLIRTPDEKPFEMPTTTDRRPMYVKYGEFHFTMKGKEHQLDVYAGLQIQKMKGYEDYLFLPFTDETNKSTTYGGGRYLECRAPKKGDKVILDFNKAFNPYCAYNHKYSCPIVPKQNHISQEVTAGVMYKK